MLKPAIAGGWLTVFSNYFLVPGLLWTVVSLIDGTTELAIGAHFANNIGGILLFNITGSAVTTTALFTISKYHATYGALSMLVAIPVFLAIVQGVQTRRGIRTCFPERSEGSSVISSVCKTISKRIKN